MLLLSLHRKVLFWFWWGRRGEAPAGCGAEPRAAARILIAARSGRRRFGAPTARAALEDVAVMQQAVEHGGDGGDVAEQFSPVFDGTVRSQQCAGALVAAHDDLQQILGRGQRQLAHAEVIDDEQRHGRQRLHELLARAVERPLRPVLRAARAFRDTSRDSPVGWRPGRWPGPSDFCRCRPDRETSASSRLPMKAHVARSKTRLRFIFGLKVKSKLSSVLIGIAEPGLLAPALQQPVAAPCQFVGDQAARSDRWAPWVRLAPDAAGFPARRPCRRGGVVVRQRSSSMRFMLRSPWFCSAMRSRYSVSWRIRGSTWRRLSGSCGLPLQVAAHEAVLAGAHFQGGGAGIIDRGGAVLLGQRQHAENAAHGRSRRRCWCMPRHSAPICGPAVSARASSCCVLSGVFLGRSSSWMRWRPRCLAQVFAQQLAGRGSSSRTWCASHCTCTRRPIQPGGAL